MATELKPEVKVQIGGEDEILRYSQNLFLYRCSSIGQGIDFVDGSPKSFASMVNIIWALLVDHRRYKTPEDLAEAIDLDTADELLVKINEAIEAGTTPEDEKKSAPSESGQPPVLNSA